MKNKISSDASNIPVMSVQDPIVKEKLESLIKLAQSLIKFDKELSRFQTWMKTQPDSKISVALDLMLAVHKDDVRKDGTTYLGHPLEVAFYLIEKLGISDPDLIIAALLHDSHEDHPKEVTLDLIEKNFGPRVRSIITGLTNPVIPPEKLEGLSDRAKKQVEMDYYLIHVKEAIQNDDVLVIKFIDFSSNALKLDGLKNKPEQQARLAAKYLPLVECFEARLRECKYTSQFPEIAQDFENAIPGIKIHAQRWYDLPPE